MPDKNIVPYNRYPPPRPGHHQSMCMDEYYNSLQQQQLD